MGFKGEKKVCCLVERSVIFAVRKSLQEYIVVVFFFNAPVTI
jgi:hypothetical protein